MSNSEPRSPLTIIAIFAGIIEASALASLPFLGEDNQQIYTWFLVGFPFFLTVLFFLTLNFNYKSLYSPESAESVEQQTTLETLSTALPEVLQNIENEITTKETDSVEKPTKQYLPIASGQTRQAEQIPTTVTITLAGAGSQQLIERFATQALSQSNAPFDTWIICNLESGTRTTLVTKLINR